MILFFGPTGAGKSVQGQSLASEKGWKWVSTGNLLRESGDAKVLAQLQTGELIASETVYGLLNDAFEKGLDPNKIVLDGFPRKLEQAQWLVQHLTGRASAIEAAVVLEVPREELFRRIEARGRSGDDPQVISERLDVYEKEVGPILNYLESCDVPVIKIDGTGDIDGIHQRIMKAVGEI